LASVAAAAPKTSPNALVQHFYKADPDYGTGVAIGLGLDIKKIAASIDTMVMAD
jgi:catalase